MKRSFPVASPFGVEEVTPPTDDSTVQDLMQAFTALHPNEAIKITAVAAEAHHHNFGLISDTSNTRLNDMNLFELKPVDNDGWLDSVPVLSPGFRFRVSLEALPLPENPADRCRCANELCHRHGSSGISSARYLFIFVKALQGDGIYDYLPRQGSSVLYEVLRAVQDAVPEKFDTLDHLVGFIATVFSRPGAPADTACPNLTDNEKRDAIDAAAEAVKGMRRHKRDSRPIVINGSLTAYNGAVLPRVRAVALVDSAASVQDVATNTTLPATLDEETRAREALQVKLDGLEQQDLDEFPTE